MPATPITPQTITLAGLSLISALADAVNGNSIPGTGDVIVMIENQSDDPIAVTIDSPAAPLGLALAQAGGSVPGGAVRWFGPFKVDTFNQTDGTVLITYDAAGALIAALRTR